VVDLIAARVPVASATLAVIVRPTGYLSNICST